MTTSWRSGCWKLGLVSVLVVGGALVQGGDRAFAQNITLDGTLGTAQALTGPDYVIPQAVGKTVDSNLFHSFGKFSLDPGESAGFQSAANIRNILSRVTGGSPSLIDGLIYTQSSSVNLFLINPSGIQFGPNAKIDVGGVTRGSFVATTVDALVWPNDGQFSATNPDGADSLLTIVDDPSGFLSSLKPPQPIASSGSSLGVYEGQSLLLLGGDVTLDDSYLYVDYFEGGRIDLGGVSGAGTVGLNVDGNDLRFSFPNDVARADVSITNGTVIDVVAEDGGSVAINARNLDVLEGSRLRTGIASGSGSVDSKAGDIEINATGAINFTNESLIANLVLEEAVGDGGDINVTARSLSFTNGGRLFAGTFGRGDAGDVIIQVSDTISFDGVSSDGFISGAFNNVISGAVGNGGDINVTARSLSFTNGGQLSAGTSGQGDAGNVTIQVSDTISFDEGSDVYASGVYSRVRSEAVGNGGDINVTARSLSFTNGGRLSASTSGQGDAGNVTIQVSDAISFDRVSRNGFVSGIFSGVEDSEAVGNGGDINVTARSLSFTNGGQLSAGTSGQGDAGDVTIQVSDTISFDEGSDEYASGVYSLVDYGAVGNGGDINVTARSLSFTNGGRLVAATSGQGDAGNLTIEASDTISLDGVSSNGFSSGLSSSVEATGAGNGGDINITTGSLSLTNGAQLQALTQGYGDAGNLTIAARDTVSFDMGYAFSNVEATGIGNGGDINITTGSLSLTNGALVVAGTSGQGDAGNLTIEASDTISFDGESGGFSTVEDTGIGNGGDINITTGSLFVTNGARLSTSTLGQGNAGNLTIAASDTISFDGASSNGFSSGGFSNVEATGIGNSGDINITTGSLSLTNGAQVVAGTRGQGDAGNLTIEASDTISFDGESDALSTVEDTGIGNGGDINITTGSLSLTDSAQLSASTEGRGNAGSVFVHANDSVSLANSDILNNVGSGAVGNGGGINITTGSLSLTNGAQLFVSTFGQGDAGSVMIDARDTVSFDGVSSDGFSSGAFSSVGEGVVGNGGGINITTGSLFVTNGAELNASTFGQGDAGSVTIHAGSTVSFDGGDAFSTVGEEAVGNGGGINITTGSLSVTDGAFLSASTFGQGSAGSVNILARDTVSFDGVSSDGFSSGAFSSVGEGAVGNGGGIDITTGSLSVTNGAQLDSRTFGQGDAGSVAINARDTIAFDGGSTAFSSVAVGAVGNGGGIKITTESLSLTNGAELIASTFGQGDAGSVMITARDTVSFDGVSSDGFFSGAFSRVAEEAVGNGGGIKITTGSLSLTNGAELIASTFGQGDAGSVFVQADDSVSLASNSQIRSTVELGATGNGNQVNIQARTLSVNDGAQISASTSGEGDSGNIQVNVTESVNLIGTSADGRSSGLFTETASVGSGGELTITTGQLLVQDGAEVSALTSSSGQGGTLTVTAPESVNLTGGGRLSAQATGNGNAGDLTVNTRQLTVQDGAEVSASTTSGIGGDITLAGLNSLRVSNGSQISASTATGQAGSLRVNAFENAADSVQLSGEDSGLFAQATGEGGTAGDLTINTLALAVQDGAEVTVSSPQGQAGNLTVMADSVLLDRGNLTAETGKGQGEGGANITLQVQDILQLRNESRISADALATANGGNINIETDFLIAQPPTGPSGSDIRANAVEGNGGRLNITAQGIFGLEFRLSETPLNDITASSEFGAAGVVTLNTPDVDPSRGLVTLPAELVDASNQIAAGCAAAGENEFIVTGRGGLPPSPNEALSSNAVWDDLRPPSAGNNSSGAATTPPTSTTSVPTIIEAQGWVIGANGEVELIAQAPTVTLNSSQWTPDTCHAP